MSWFVGVCMRNIHIPFWTDTETFNGLTACGKVCLRKSFSLWCSDLVQLYKHFNWRILLPKYFRDNYNMYKMLMDGWMDGWMGKWKKNIYIYISPLSLSQYIRYRKTNICMYSHILYTYIYIYIQYLRKVSTPSHYSTKKTFKRQYYTIETWIYFRVVNL